jgi:hypothetical protein
VKAQPSLEWAEDTAHFHPVAAIDLDLAGVVHPGDPKNQAAFGFDKALQYGLLGEVGPTIHHRLYPGNQFFDRLVEFLFLRISVFQPLDDIGHDLPPAHREGLQWFQNLVYRSMTAFTSLAGFFIDRICQQIYDGLFRVLIYDRMGYAVFIGLRVVFERDSRFLNHF